MVQFAARATVFRDLRDEQQLRDEIMIGAEERFMVAMARQ
jgi:hypothetical protein